MALEIERKFLVKNNDYRSMAVRKVEMTQGYLSVEPSRTVRIRVKDRQGFITIKGLSSGPVRSEWEYEIPATDAFEMLKLPGTKSLSKTRYLVPWQGKIWEVDEFHGKHKGLVLAEIELKDPDEVFNLPSFIGREVTGEERYYNSVLVAET